LAKNEIIDIGEYDDNPFGLFEQLQKIGRTEIGNKDKKTTELIVELNKKQGVDLCEFAVQAIDSGFSCFDAHHILEDAIPYLELNKKTTYKYLNRLFDSMQGDLMSGSQYRPIANLAKEQPKFARELLEDLIESGEPFVVGYISAILENLPNIGIEDLHNEILTLISHIEEPVVQGAVITLGNLKYDINTHKEIIDKTFIAFDGLLEKNSEAINQAIASSLGELYYLGIEAQSRLLALSKRNDPQICFQVSRFLVSHYKGIINDEWFKELLMTLSATHCQYKGIIDNLDHVLYSLLGTESNQSLFECFFTAWLINSDYQQNEQKLDSLFGSTLSKLSKNSVFFDALVTKYLNHDNYKVNQAAAVLIRYSNLYKNRPICLDQSIIESFDIDDVLYICRKILGYLFEVKTLCSLIYSVLTAKAKDTNVKGLVHNIFLNHIAMDYPGTTLEFLKERLSIVDLPKELESTVRNIVDALESRQKILNSLPRLNELFVPTRYSYQISLEESKNMSKAMEKAQEGSITSMIATKIPLKYGKSWFSYRNGKYCSPSNLSSFSHSIEVPRSEIDNPVSASMQRVGFRMARRGDS
jgi:hypothetical protein